MSVSELAQRLPAAPLLARWSQSLAILDAILSPERPFIRQPPAVRAGLLESVPATLEPARSEPAFAMNGIPLVTIVLWRLPSDDEWSFGQASDPDLGDDGGTWLFEQLDGSADSYTSFARDYYERDVDAATVERIMGHAPLREQDVLALNPALTLVELNTDLVQIGYPAGS
jgi:hypothetical protein